VAKPKQTTKPPPNILSAC